MDMVDLCGDRSDHSFHNVILNIENLVQKSIIAFRPENSAAGNFQLLGVDPDLVTHTAQIALIGIIGSHAL